MIDRLFSSAALVALEKGIDATALRQQVIANNVANVNTPDYKKQEVRFEEEFKRAIKNKYEPRLLQTDSRHLPSTSSFSSIGARVSTVQGSSMRQDGNNVDIDEEMINLAENGIRYNAMAKLIGSRFASLKTVISGGR